MSSPRAKAASKYAAIAREIGEELLTRELSARTVLFHQAVADRLGIGPTDHKCLDLASHAGDDGPLTAGRLADLTGLTTGAITGVLDRLEKAGFVRREKDPSDRRQIVVRVLPSREREMGELILPLRQGFEELCARYDEAELVTVRDFLRAASELFEREAKRLRGTTEPTSDAEATSSTHEISAPLGDASAGRLNLPKGASALTLGVARKGQLYRLRSEGQAPIVTAHDGRVTVEWRRRLLDFGRSTTTTTLDLGPDVPWKIAVHGGASKVTADLRKLAVVALDVHGGASEVTLALPRPSGELRVRIHGGVSHVRITRPEGVPLRVFVAEGANKLAVDALKLGAVGDGLRWEWPGYDKAPHRLDVAVHGGADHLTIAEE